MLTLHQPRLVLIEPIDPDGMTQGGLYTAHSRLRPPTMGRIVAVSKPSEDLLPGDVVIFRPHAYDTYDTSEGTIHVIHEQAIQAVLDGYDEAADRLPKPSKGETSHAN